MREERTEDIVHDEIMQCQKNFEKKCFQIQETTFKAYNVSQSIIVYLKNVKISMNRNLKVIKHKLILALI